MGSGNTKVNTADFKTVEKAMFDQWQKMQEAIAKITEQEKKDLEEHFNMHIDGEGDLGTILLDNSKEGADNFDCRVRLLDDEVRQKYADELVAQGVVNMEKEGD